MSKKSQPETSPAQQKVAARTKAYRHCQLFNLFSYSCSTLLLLVITAMTSAQSFIGLGDLPGGGLFYSEAYDVSSDGSVVVGQTYGTNGSEAFRWTSAEGMVGLGYLPGGGLTAAYAVSADGNVVVGQNNGTGIEAFRWTSAGGMIGLGDFPGGQFQSAAFAASADGSVVVGWGWSVSGLEAFRWNSTGGMVGLGDLSGGSFNSGALGVSSNGSVVVGWGTRSSPGIRAFRWTSGGGMTDLGGLPGANSTSRASAVSADGSVVVGRGAGLSGQEAFRWTSGGGMLGLGDLPGSDFNSEALGVSHDGSVVVGMGRSASGDEAFIWDPVNGMRNLRDVLTNEFGLGAALAGWKLTAARALSGDGMTIVGYGINSMGQSEGWTATMSFPAPKISWDVRMGQIELSWPVILPGCGLNRKPMRWAAAWVQTGSRWSIHFSRIKSCFPLIQTMAACSSGWQDPNAAGTNTNIPAETKPYTSAATESQRFFRLIGN